MRMQQAEFCPIARMHFMFQEAPGMRQASACRQRVLRCLWSRSRGLIRLTNGQLDTALIIIEIEGFQQLDQGIFKGSNQEGSPPGSPLMDEDSVEQGKCLTGITSSWQGRMASEIAVKQACKGGAGTAAT